MNEVKTLSKKKAKVKRPKPTQEQETVNKLIAKNPQLQTLIDKLDLVIIKTSEL